MEIRKEGGLRGAGAPDEARLAKINAYARTPLTAEAVYCFRVRLCDDRPDRDFERFDTAALPRMAELFRGKTGICDHQWSADRQVARIFDTQVVREDDGASCLMAEAYVLRTERNADLIADIEGGIKKEVSVGCAMGRRAARSAASPTAPVRTARARSMTAKRAWPCSRSRSMHMNFPLWRSRRSGRRA